MYQRMFGDRDPVAEPGTTTGTPGNWWTVHALDPDLFQLLLQRHAWQWSESRQISPLIRELAVTRGAWARGSQFIFSQHCRILQEMGVSQERIDALPSWTAASCYDENERAALGYADDLVLGGGRCSDGRFAELHRLFSDVQILELTFLILTFAMSSAMCRALRLEYDDFPDRIVEVNPEISGTDRSHQN